MLTLTLYIVKHLILINNYCVYYNTFSLYINSLIFSLCYLHMFW